MIKKRSGGEQEKNINIGWGIKEREIKKSTARDREREGECVIGIEGRINKIMKREKDISIKNVKHRENTGRKR